jgi:hypothetical protein
VHCATVPPPPSAGKIPCPQSPQLGPYSINQTRRPRTSQVIYILLFDWTGLLGVFSAACTCTPSCCLGLLGKLQGRPSFSIIVKASPSSCVTFPLVHEDDLPLFVSGLTKDVRNQPAEPFDALVRETGSLLGPMVGVASPLRAAESKGDGGRWRGKKISAPNHLTGMHALQVAPYGFHAFSTDQALSAPQIQ